MTKRRRGRPRLGVYPINLNLRVGQEEADQLNALHAQIQQHNHDPSILRADVLRAIFDRGISQLSAELTALKAKK